MLTVKVKPGASCNMVEMVKDGVYSVKTTALAEKGAANQQVIKLLADHLDVPKSSLIIKSGAGSHTKLIDLL